MTKFQVSGEKQHAVSHSHEDVGNTTPTKTNLQNFLKICMFNARILKNKFSDLEALAASDDFHIIGVSELWINTENRDFLVEYNLSDYSMFSCEQQDKKKVEVF